MVSRHKNKRREPRRAGELLSRALKDLGLPSERVGERLRRAWKGVAEPAWEGHTSLRRIEGGVLEIGVGAAPLREELAQFHTARLLDVLRKALPDVSLIGLHFVLDSTAGDAGGRNNS